MKRDFRVALVLLCVSGCVTSGHLSEKSAPESVQSRELVPFLNGSTVYRYRFENGLKLLVLEDHSSPTFSYQTWYRVGSIDETPGRTGLAHLFEHMMFKQTKNQPAGSTDRILEGAGVEGRNAFTTKDCTVYIQELLKEDLGLIAQLEADRMENLVIDEKAFQTEREVVHNERRSRRENNPDGLLYDGLFSLAFQHHPYHWPVIGYAADLTRMKAQDAVDFYTHHYSPHHATIVVVGDVESAKVRSTVEKYYAPISAHSPQADHPHVIPQEPVQRKVRQKTLSLNIQLTKWMVGYHVPGILHPDMPALNVLQSILAGGPSSRLHQALVDTGIASLVQSEDMDMRDPGLLIFLLHLQKSQMIQAERELLRVIQKLQTELVSEQELARAKNKIDFEYYNGLRSQFQKALFLGHAETQAGDFQKMIESHKKIRTITPKEVQRVAQRYLQQHSRSSVIGVPK